MLRDKIKQMKQGVAVNQVVEEEMEDVCKRYPYMRSFYQHITRYTYAKMLRNRISALKSRMKKKGESEQLDVLREMARRLFLLKKYNLLPEKDY